MGVTFGFGGSFTLKPILCFCCSGLRRTLLVAHPHGLVFVSSLNLGAGIAGKDIGETFVLV